MGFVVKSPLWSDHVIPFEIDPAIEAHFQSRAFATANPGVTVESTRMIEEAVSHWNAVAPIRLERRAGQSHFLRFKLGPKGNGGHAGASSSGEAEITFDYEWSLGTNWNIAVAAMVHEIGHIAGLIHEHQRPDRDNFVTFSVPTETNGDIKKLSDTDGTKVGRYDCLSIMHYKPRTPPDFAAAPGGCAAFGLLDDPKLSTGDVAALECLYPPRLAVAVTPAGVANRAKSYSFQVTRADKGSPVGGARIRLRNAGANQLMVTTSFVTDAQGRTTRTVTLRHSRKVRVIGGRREVEMVPPSVEALAAGFESVSMPLLPEI